VPDEVPQPQKLRATVEKKGDKDLVTDKKVLEDPPQKCRKNKVGAFLSTCPMGVVRVR
jgi:hypothetical protein